MNRHHLCLLFVVSLAAWLVKSESTIEVDENGDEYDVKRFNIQGRQLNGGRSQCVEIRTKRAAQLQPQPQPLYFDNVSNDENENEDDNDNDDRSDIIYSPPVISSAVAEEHDEEKEDAIKIMNEMISSYTNVKNNSKSKEHQKNEDNEKGDDDITKVIQLPPSPILEQLQNADESAASSASSVTHEANTDGIVVVQSHKPPKVNPQTHAVFELIPVENVITEADHEEENNKSDFDDNKGQSPVSVTSNWSTGDGSSSDIYNDYDENPVKVQKLKKSKHQKKPNHENKYHNGATPGLGSGNKISNKNRPNKTNAQRPIKTRKTPSAKRNRRPNSNKNRNKATRNSASNNRHRYYNNRNRLIAKRNKNRKKAQVVDNGEYTFTRTYTWTSADDDDYDYGDANVSCIIIRKETPAPTTERPFWNFWKRSANGSRQTASDQFGKRKRTNLRFVA